MIYFTLEENSEFIELIKLLKVTNICSSGGEAKHLVEMGEVKLNGVVESRKRAKLRAGDKIEVFDERIEIKNN
ncbi:MAG: RNA-binding S4 domain-containing protein [Bacteroidales bacterium]|jgi:ribosome-associated protein|nr:RNA-binding S4 domain-containing protein [Bacteroidales bacterium]